MFLLLILVLFFYPEQVRAASSVQIQSCLPNPSDEANEYIELFNPNSENIDLGGYQLDDEPNAGSKPYKIPSGTTINANSSLRFPKSQTGIALNNSKQKDQPFADTVRLIDSAGNQIDSLTYSSTQTDVPITRASPPTSSPQPTVTPTSLPTQTPTALPTSKPRPTLTLAITPQLTNTLSPTGQVLSAIISPADTASSVAAVSPKDRQSASSFPIGQILIGLGGLATAAGVYLARYTSSYYDH